eukprot:Skav202868  [mRNA]  locus=scaffold3206:207446:209819:- [translate_table: standard]
MERAPEHGFGKDAVGVLARGYGPWIGVELEKPADKREQDLKAGLGGEQAARSKAGGGVTPMIGMVSRQ